MNVEGEVKKAFPDRVFRFEKTTKVYVKDYEFFNSHEFIEFLEALAKKMTDDKYIGTDFYLDE
jgi:hypothetical protein